MSSEQSQHVRVRLSELVGQWEEEFRKEAVDLLRDVDRLEEMDRRVCEEDARLEALRLHAAVLEAPLADMERQAAQLKSITDQLASALAKSESRLAHRRPSTSKSDPSSVAQILQLLQEDLDRSNSLLSDLAQSDRTDRPDPLHPIESLFRSL